MVSIKELYSISENEWKSYFKLFKACDEDIFHKSMMEGSWSVEKILRHLLGSLVQINNNALNTEKLSTKLTFDFTKNPDDRVPLSKIEEEYHRLNKVISKGMEEITEEQEKENITFGGREIPRGRFLIRLFAHEQSHFGQVIWILRRATNWSLEEIFKIIETSPFG